MPQGPRFKGVYSTSLTGDRAIAIAKEHQAANEADGTDDPLFMYLAFQVRGSRGSRGFHGSRPPPPILMPLDALRTILGHSPWLGLVLTVA